MGRETWVQSQVESYQRLKKWYLMPPCLTLSIIRYGSRVKRSNPGKGVAPSPTPWCSNLSKREPSGHPRLWSPTLLTFYIYIFERPVSSGPYQAVNAIKIFKRVNVVEKSKGMEERGGRNKKKDTLRGGSSSNEQITRD